MRKRAGIIEASHAGTDAVEYSNVTKTEGGKGYGLGRVGYWPGDILQIT